MTIYSKTLDLGFLGEAEAEIHYEISEVCEVTLITVASSLTNWLTDGLGRARKGPPQRVDITDLVRERGQLADLEQEIWDWSHEDAINQAADRAYAEKRDRTLLIA